jgi:hypothetical protein
MKQRLTLPPFSLQTVLSPERVVFLDFLANLRANVMARAVGLQQSDEKTTA